MSVKKPSGLKIARSDNVFVLSWKHGESYSAQKAHYRYNGGSWTALGNIKKGTTTATLTFSKSVFNPYTSNRLSTIQFRVNGKKSKTWSGWKESSVMTLYAPNAPSVSSEYDSNSPNKASYSWNCSYATDNVQPFTYLQWESILVESDDTVTDGSKAVGWGSNAAIYDRRTGTGTATSYTVDITENTEALATGSHTRWFRAWTRGMANNSAFAYTKQVYASPFKAVISSASADVDSAGYNCRVSWSAQATPSHPLESTTVQYTMCVPSTGLIPPNGAQWNDAVLSADISRDTYRNANTQNRNDTVTFHIDGVLKENECLFVRVNTKWQNNVTYSDAKMVLVGELSEPSGVQVNVNTNTITATNEASEIPDSFLVVRYRCGEEEFDIGIIPHATGSRSITVSPPSSHGKSMAYGVYAVVGTYTQTTRADGGRAYSVDAIMKSKEVWQGGSVPVAPEIVKIAPTGVAGTIRVEWNWTWEDATRAVLSWADHEDAWESTEAPEEYEINNPLATAWNIGGLATGKTWYVRMRLDNVTEDATTEGPWSEQHHLLLSTAPAVPTLAVAQNNGFVNMESDVTLYWSYISTDGTGQADAAICDGSTDNILARTTTAQQITFRPSDIEGWSAGQTHALRLRVTSQSQKMSEWSAPVYLTIVPEIHASITSTSLVNATEEQAGRLGASAVLTALPLTVTSAGAGADGTSVVTIKRAEPYHVDRPDESDFHGYNGETVATYEYSGDGSIEISADNKTVLFGSLDDTAKYTLTLTVKDKFNQTDSASMDFGVEWSHQASAPSSATATVNEELVAILVAQAPSDALETDKVDIYRLSADKPELVIEDGEFGVSYVDPFPAINGGYRFVTKTADGDYIAPDDIPAWVDVETDWDYDRAIIDFNGEQVQLYYNVDVSNSWEKGFQSTKYLGGAVKGDWDAGVVRTSTISTVAFTEYNADVIEGLRRLAEYTGICHVRTLDGSSYSADLQVQEDRDHDDYGVKASFSISGTRVDPEEPDGLTLEEWSEGDELE